MVLGCCVGGSSIFMSSGNSLGIVSIVKRCASAQKPCMVAGWVWVDVCELVGKCFAGCVGWCVGWLVPPTPTPPTDHKHFSVKRCVSTQNPCKVGVWVTKKKKNGVNNKYVLCAKKKSTTPDEKIINNNAHQQPTLDFMS